jgi:hypothetical protein
MWGDKTRQTGAGTGGLTSSMQCARCDAELEANSLGGLCPVCLLDSAWPDDGRDEGGDFRYDLIEEIARGGMGVVEAALVAVLPTGNYTAIVSGKNGGTSVGLVEVYNLD